MKIRIHKEKFINHECPDIPKKVMDVYYSKFMITCRNWISYNDIKNGIKNIDIRVNQSYKGSNKFHFYTSINKLPEYHTEIHIADSHHWEFDGKVDKTHPRCEWIVDLEKYFNISISDKPRKKLDKIWYEIEQKRKTLDRVRNLKFKWKNYLELKEFFNR